ncbi:FAD-binding and (Fe-S)-binding domain-containing protein [Psychrobium sp. 1_MG-2023]|uniref:FAD-binding and (Fe-S)-binding domain-containing protein n=1 Tax=Psychrobium sp. 1_MG-2023 TaxID=3062624 RepID=UPI000C33D02B|nr:FAD-binding and (Fe-S)-binding domain-containing protein [Psychrobium sp. 1_MG-2023]MDP2559670.1 FAD-binding and (Fe-S)-binding domain-containing protein [Psychrobium sp. 1_MG-2023]PKF59501.1 4Fe-4S ferredoxin [Alteromonadales bacterium alter-6D02]
MRSKNYQQFIQQAETLLPQQRIISDYSKRFAYGTDASFYRLTPEVVVLIDNENELIAILQLAVQLSLAVTFRAAGTSLSGQAQSDSILIMLTDSWRDYEVLDLGQQIKLQPGLIGNDVNQILAPYGRKIGPDPASINSCKIGGIAANNASGMCCGVAHNSYNTLANIRIVLFDGSVLDTSDPESIVQFRHSHQQLLAGLTELQQQLKDDEQLSELIRHKYRLKNTTGYGINSLLDFEDPIDILAHLMIGSEGSLGFISNITYNTVVEHKYKASAMVFFPTIDITCHAVSALASANVTAVELLDGRSLASVNDMPGLPEFIKAFDLNVSALLIETAAANDTLLDEQINELNQLLSQFEQQAIIDFTKDPKQYAKLWGIRKSTFPAVGAVRETGTTVIIEDVAFPVEHLAKAVSQLQQLFDKYHYEEAIIFGHALEGNLHFVFTQDFSTQAEVERYQAFMDDVCHLVAVDYQGSLKAEHGTGRNMAPFVEMEWGGNGYDMMVQIKKLFDPQQLLNPGVIINDDPLAHINDLKALPPADEIVDKCIECGFCEAVCPSKGLTLTPRQRITSYREIQRLRASGNEPQQLAELEQDFNYLGIDTCAATGLCADRCPVGINTGDLIRQLRHENNQSYHKVANVFGRQFKRIEQSTRIGLTLASYGQKLLGDRLMQRMTDGIRKVSANKVPLWTSAMPSKAAYHAKAVQIEGRDNRPKVVYMPSCASRTMGPSINATEQRSLPEITYQLLTKAGFDIIRPDFSGQCCGMPFNSKGFFEQASQKRSQLAHQLLNVSNQGEYPILFDTSPCKSMMLEGESEQLGLNIYEPVQFVSEILTPHLTFKPINESVMIHVTCSSQKMGLGPAMIALAKRCASDVIVPKDIQCCGFAGDKGFNTPELNAHALATLKSQVPSGCINGYSNSRTCEIGLSHHSAIDYQSILYLVDRATTLNSPDS